ncbi:MAG: C25 family cysteine peptidase [Bacteroidota bacterium]
MRRIYIIICVILGVCSYAFSQQYANGWIDYSQTYYRIPVIQDGVYKITHTDLISHGISIGDFDPRSIQIFHKGESIPVFVYGQDDGIFNSSDYIEFYAEKNTGWLDTAIYKTGIPLNPNYSLYNDTASYFLCFANTISAERYDTSRNTNFSGLTPLSYCLKTSRANYTSEYNNSLNAAYILNGEGWVDDFFTIGESVTKALSTSNYTDVGIPYTLSFGVCGRSETRHDLIVETDDFLFDTIYSDYNAVHKTFEINETLSSTTQITFRSLWSSAKTADKNSVAYVEITYPHAYNFQGRQSMNFTIPKVSGSNDIYIEVVNFDGGAAPILFCPELNKRFAATKDGVKYKFRLPNPEKKCECILINPNSYRTVSDIISTKSKNTTNSKFYDLSAGGSQEGDYIIITHKSLWNHAVTYKNYRENTGFTPVMIDVDELYNQFGYGIQKHPYAIHNFLKYATEQWNIQPEHVFIIGKGMHMPSFRKSPEVYEKTLVPAMGFPSSDLLFTTDLHGRTMRTNIAIGRLSANTAEELNAYRNKVEEHESQGSAVWMKNVMHFGGGSNATEQRLFRIYLSAYQKLMENEFFGAHVSTFLKESSTVFEKTEPEIIRELMNDGTALCTFFGHGSGAGFDQNIDHPSLFNNRGKYPLMLANSCYSGDIFQDNDYNISEMWVLIPQKGSIGFIANVDLGIPSYLNLFAQSFLNNTARFNYGNSIGTSIERTLTELSNKYMHLDKVANTSLSYVYHGDPAVKVHSFDYPDIEINETSAFFNPSFLTTDLQFIETGIIISNNGKAVSDTFNVSCTFTATSTGNNFTIDTTLKGTYYKDTIVLRLPINYFEAGAYTVYINADTENSIQELNETNNSASIDFFISSRDVLPVYPQEYAIIPEESPEFIMTAVDPLNPPESVIVELDTTPLFTSSFHISDTINTLGNAIVRWNPGISCEDSQQYFWRVSEKNELKWNESSFTYETDKTGWGQIHAHQFIKNDLSNLEYSENDKKYNFIETPHGVSCKTKGLANTEEDYFSTLYMIDNTLMANSGFPLYTAALHIVIIDSLTAEPWLANRGSYGQIYPYRFGVVKKYFTFPTGSASGRNNIANFLRDTVPEGNYILVYTFKTAYFDSWEENILTAFEELGAALPRDLDNDIPYIFFAQKGNIATAEEISGENPTDLIQLNSEFPGNYYKGNVKSTIVGPSHHFEYAVWDGEKYDGSDSTTLSIYGIQENGQEFTIDRWITKDTIHELDTLFDSSLIPYISLYNYHEDLIGRTPPLLNYWKVYYEPLGELAVSPEYAFSFHADTIEQGEEIEAVISAQNISSADMDSVLVYIEIKNPQNQIVYSNYHRVSSVRAGDYLIDTSRIDSKNFAGNYTIKIEFNPVNPETGLHDQPETYYFNNFIIVPFYVQTDKLNPIIDVIVDGRHVMQGDIISSEPEIIIHAYDENNYLFLQDTALFTLYAVNTTQQDTIPFYFADTSVVKFIPANEHSQRSTIILNPSFFENGDYALHIQVRDVSNNYAGNREYILQFSINRESKVSTLYNYPNPCKTYTTFRFVLTGKKIPEHAFINIYSENGTCISRIDLSKTNLHIGTNTISVNWQAQDIHGIALPNGIYMYTLSFDAKENYEHYQSINDGIVDKKFGKLIIAR